MKTKLFELRDRSTFIPVMAVQLSPSDDSSENWLMRRAGFAFMDNNVILCRLECAGVDYNATHDPYAWDKGARTFFVAHKYIQENFDTLAPGAVVDVEFILGETTQPKVSERETNG